MSGLLVPTTPLGLEVYLRNAAGVTGAGMTINGTSQRAGAIFTADRSASMTGFKQQFGTNTGSCVLQADLYATDPATHVHTGSSLATVQFTPASNGVSDVTYTTPFTTTSGAEYVNVLKYVSGTSSALHGAGTGFMNNAAVFSLDTDTTWFAMGGCRSLTFVPKYSGPVTVGLAMGTGQTSGSVSSVIYYNGAHQSILANKFIFPVVSGLTGWKLRWLSTGGGFKTGSPTGWNLRAVICSASAILSSSDTTPEVAQFATNGGEFFWSDANAYTMLADGSTAYYIGLTPDVNTGTNDASNNVRITTATSLVPTTIVGALQGPFESSSTTISFSSSTNIPVFEMVLEPVLGGSGGGVISPRGLSGGLF